jgi:GNAT superfamily N-acetyltransferase
MVIRLSDVTRPEIADTLNKLQAQTFPGDVSFDIKKGWWWIAYEDDAPVAFAGLAPVLSWMKTGYLARCGVLPEYRGRGLQQKLIRKREDHAKKLGMERVITTTLNNTISANNLISRGYKTYSPETAWGASDTIYWITELA